MPELPPYGDEERFLVLINPQASGGQSPATMRRRIGAAFAVHGVPFDLCVTESAGHAEAAARAAAQAGFRAIVAAGGDGTVAHVLRGTAGTDVPVAILPWGTGNQLALNFGIPVSLEGSVRVAVSGRVEAIDLGRIGDDYFALIAGAGLDAEVMAAATSDLKRNLGPAAYLFGGLKHVITPPSADYRIVADGREIELTASMVLLANVGHLGVGPLPVEVKVAPKVSFQDGLLDVCIFAARHLPDMAAMVWRVSRERYADDERMVFLQAKRVLIESEPIVATQIDGEPAGVTPLEAEIVPAAGRILVPRQGNGRTP